MATHRSPSPVSSPAVNSAEWFHNLLQEKNHIEVVREHQLKHGMDLNSGKDLFLVLATGGGKTFILQAPLQAAKARGEKGIGLMVVPTKVLAEQQALIASKYDLRALAIHEDTVRVARSRGQDLFKQLAAGNDVRLAVMSPQMLRSKPMMKLIKTAAFKNLIRWLLIDEAHLVDETTGTFHLPYRSISTMRALLPSQTTWAAVTGTATPERALAMAKALGFQPGRYINARYSVDRPNIRYVPRFLQHASSGHQFLDLSFLIPPNLSSVDQIPRTLVFATTIDTGYRIMQFLDSLIPANFPNRLQLTKLYNSIMPIDYRRNFLTDIEDGSKLRIGIVTDTCTYGLDIKNLQRVVLFNLCESYTNMMQKIGRCGRDGKPAVAVTFAPGWVKEVPEAEIMGKQGKEDAKRRANLEPVTLEWYNSSRKTCTRRVDLGHNKEQLDHDASCNCDFCQSNDADLAVVAQWKEHLAPKKGASLYPRSDQTYRPLEQMMKDSFAQMLVQWRARRWVVIQGNRRGLPADVFLSRRLMGQIIEKAHLCTTLERLGVVVLSWEYMGSHGQDLFTFVTEAMLGFKELFFEETETKKSSPILTAGATKPVASVLLRVAGPSQPLGDIASRSNISLPQLPVAPPPPKPRPINHKRRRENMENENGADEAALFIIQRKKKK